MSKPLCQPTKSRRKFKNPDDEAEEEVTIGDFPEPEEEAEPAEPEAIAVVAE